MNSSVMWWNVARYAHVWEEFNKLDINRTVVKYPGDQDYLGVVIDPIQRRYFDPHRLQSWRWQVADGGYDFAGRKPRKPGTGAGPYIGGEASILVFHGKPKPHECTADPVIASHWQ
jgi:hypothetical protein